MANFTSDELAQFGLTPVVPNNGTSSDEDAIRLGIDKPAPGAFDPGQHGLVLPDSPAGRALLQPTQSVKAAPAPWLPQDDLARGVRAGFATATGGLSDWAAALAHTAPRAIGDFFGGSPPGAAPYDFWTNLTLDRGEAANDRAQFAKDNPVGNDIGKGFGVLGGMAAAGATDALVGAGLKAVGVGAEAGPPTVGTLMARSGVSGAVQGAAAGAGNAPINATMHDVALDTGIGAVTGGLTGAALGPLAQGAVDVGKNVLGAGTRMSAGADNVLAGIAGTKPAYSAVPEVGDAISSAITAKANAYKATGNSYFESAAQKGAQAMPGVAPAIPQLVTSEIGRSRMAPVFGTDTARTAMPVASQAMDIISELSKVQGSFPVAGAPGEASLNALRERLNTLSATGTDGAALKVVRDAYNTVFDNIAAAPQGFITGDASAMSDIRAGVNAWRAYRALTAPNSNDVPGKVIANWKDSNANGAAVASDILTLSRNPKTVSAAANTVNALKMQFGPGSDEINALQQGLFLKAVGTNPAGKEPTAREVRQNLLGLVNGNAAPVGNAVWTDEQRVAIRKFAASIPDTDSSGPAALVGRTTRLAGAVAASALGLHFFGGDIMSPLTLGVATTAAGAGSVVGHTVGAAMTNHLARDAQNPLLYRPLFLSRAVRAGAEYGSGAIAGGTVAQVPGDVASGHAPIPPARTAPSPTLGSR